MAVQEGNTSLFAIFFLAIYSLVLIPYTIYKLCNPSEEAIKPWEAASKRKPSALVSYIRRVGTSTVITLVVAWAAWLVIVFYVQATAKDMVPFDPFAILGVSHEATKQEVSSAYRKMALKYHPDRNPDPEAAQFFAESITKAYKALTDPAARENYEKYGHPDGQQAMRMSIALPDWLLNSDSKRAPWVLGMLVVGGILLPLILAARYLMQSHRYAGPNAVMAETMEIFFRSQFGVKQSQSLAKIPDTLVMAMEFIQMPTPSDQAEGLEELRKTTLRLFPELRDNKQAWFKKRKASIVKAHMLLLAHLDREAVPPSLAADHKFVTTKCILLLEEMVKIANIPRAPGQTWGWLAPTVGSLEMMQCITQGVSQASRKSLGATGKAGQDSSAVLLQLPHMTAEVLRKMVRKRMRTLADLLLLSPPELEELLTSSGLSSSEAQDVATALASVPTVKLADVGFQLEGEQGDIVQGDVVTCTANVTLHRASHAHKAFRAPAEGQAVQAYAPSYPGVREERWWFMLANVPQNAVMALNPTSLLRAEAAGVALQIRPGTPAALEASGEGAGDTEAEGARENGHKASNGVSEHQTVQLQFAAPGPGKFDLTLLCISDCWVGCDVALPLKLRVSEQTRAEREGRAAKQQAAAAAASEPPLVSDDDADGPTGDGDEDEEDGEVSGEGEWDSDETGTDETGSDSDTEESSQKPPLTKDASPADNGSSVSSSTNVSGSTKKDL